MKLAFVDTETTGTHPINDRIIEIAVIIYEDGKVLDTFETLVNPQMSFDPFITQITGIKPADLVNAPAFEDIALTLRELLDGCILAAHNARFDYAFIKNEFKRINVRYHATQLCTVKLSRSLYPHHRHHSLDDIIARFGFTCDARHRAMGDAQILLDFYNYLLVNIPRPALDMAVNQILGRPSLPSHVDPDILVQIPESPGVYIFYNQDQIPLYVGKSINLKSRVISHFHESISSSKEMKLAQLTYSIETRITGGELSALILESQLVKELQPIHNRQLRLSRKLFVVSQTVDANGYNSVDFNLVSQIDPSTLNNILGIFKSKRQAENALSQIADEYQLCPALLGLESKGLINQAPSSKKHPCFSYHLGKCKGACRGEEKPLFYNLRFQQAFYHTRLKSWPFPGPVIITESHPDSDISQSFIVDQWCIILEFSQDIDLSSDFREQLPSEVRNGFSTIPNYSQSPYQFDLDTYKILKRFVMNPKNQDKIKILKTS